MLHWFAKRLREMQKVRRDERGFTLLELLIVVIIIGVLAAIAIPVFLAQQRKAEIATCESDARNAAAASSGYRAGPGNGTYTGMDVAALETQGFNPTNNTTGNYPVTVTVTDANTASISVGCKGSGSATWDSGSGKVTSPST
jgi:type IV pilus assembly protein PilA